MKNQIYAYWCDKTNDYVWTPNRALALIKSGKTYKVIHKINV